MSNAALFEFPFTGREREMLSVVRILDRTIAGEGGMVFVTGEPGIGKTRFSNAISDMSRARGFLCLSAKSPRGGSLLPYSVWVDCLRQLISQMSVLSFVDACGPNARLILKLLPELDASILGPQGRSSETQQTVKEVEATSPIQIFDAVTQFIYRLSTKSPALIILDDFQWCDKSSLDLLRYLTGSGFGNRKITILCMCRDPGMKNDNPGLHDFISEISAARGSNIVLHLERFGLADTKSLIRSVASMGRASDAFCNSLHRKTGGNPLFVRELLALLDEKSGTESGAPPRWEALSQHELGIPDTVEEVVKLRLAPLGRELIEALTVAALIGEEFNLAILSEASSIHDEKRLFELLQYAENVGIVRRADILQKGKLYSFDDEVSMDVLIEKVSPEEFTAYHLAIGQIMERVYSGRLDEHAAELAVHFQKGGDWQKSYEYSSRAGRFAASAYAHDEAFSQFTLALKSVEELGSEGAIHSRGELLEGLGDASMMLGNVPAAFQSWNKAIKEYENYEEWERAADAHRRVGYILTVYFVSKENKDLAFEHLTAAENILERGQRKPPLAYLYHHLATWHWYYGEFDAAREYCQKSIELAVQWGLNDLEALCSCIMGFTSRIDDQETAWDHFRCAEKATEKGRHSANLTLMSPHPTMMLGWAYSYMTDVASSSLPHFVEATEMAMRIGDLFAVLIHQSFAAWFGHQPLGDWSEAKKKISPTLSMPALESINALAELGFGVQGCVDLFEGDLGKAEDSLLKAYAAIRRMPGAPGFVSVIGASEVYGYLGCLYMETGDYNRAEKYLGEGYTLVKGRGPLVDNSLKFAEILVLMVEICERQGKRREALAHLEELRNLKDMANSTWALARFLNAASFMAAAAEDWEKALEAQLAASNCWKSLERPYEFAKSTYELARIYQNLGRLEEASILFGNAKDAFDKLGARLDLDKVVSALRESEDSSALSILKLRGSAKESSRLIFDYLVLEFIGDYYSRKLAPEASGWRTFGDISRQTKLPVSSFYQREAKNNGGLGELERMGIVEVRSYSGERGRGGTVTRVRVAYEKEEIKKHVSRRIARTSRNLHV